MDNAIDVQVCGAHGMIPCTYKTVVLKPNIVDDKNILTQSMINKPNTKYVIKYDFLISDVIVTKTANVVSTNISQCGNAAYATALAAYNLAHNAWIDADNAYTNNPNDTTLAAKNAAYAALESAQHTLNGTPQYYYFAGSAINIKKGQHIAIPEGCVLLNDTRTSIVSFDVAPNDMTVYIGSAIIGSYDYKIQDGIVMPANCLIEFDGGSISNGAIVGDDTYLIFNQNEEDILKNVTLLDNFIYPTANPADKKDNINGMAKVYLKKNKSFASQLTQQNTIYVIQYDFTLDENITIPENCILEFDGGSISGEYTITGANTGIEASLVKIFNTDVSISGSWNVAEAYPEWFGAKGDGSTDDTLSVQKVCRYFTHIIIQNKYKCAQSIDIINDYTTVEGRGTIYFTNSLEISGKNCDNLIFRNFRIVSISGYSGVGLVCGDDTYITNIKPNTKIHYKNILIDHVEVDNFSSGYKEMEFGVNGIFVKTGTGASISNITIQNCISRGAGCDPNALNTLNGSDNICVSSYSSHAAPMENVKILNNFCEYAGRQNLSLASDNKDCIVNVVIQGNTFKDSTMAGIDLERASKVMISNNTFIGSGKYIGYYDPADSVRHNNFMLQSAIACSADESWTIIGCTFMACRNACGYGAHFVNCHFVNTPFLQTSAAAYTFKCSDSKIEFSDADIKQSIVVYGKERTELINCGIDFGNTTARVLSSLLVDGCSIKADTEDVLFQCGSADDYMFNNTIMNISNGTPFGQIANEPTFYVIDCDITAKEILLNRNNTRKTSLRNNKLKITSFNYNYHNTNNKDFTLVINGNEITASSPIVFGIGLSADISNNTIFIASDYVQPQNTRNGLIYFWSNRNQPTKINVKDNYINNIPDNITALVSERAFGMGYNVNIYNITGNVLTGNEVEGRVIKQQEGRKSSTAASLIERNNFNGVDLTQ